MSNTLKFANTGPQMSHMIKDHPKETAIPEAVRNMIEATTAWLNNNKQKEAEVHIRKLNIERGLIGWQEANGKTVEFFKDKLSFLNPGGMTATELTTAFCQIGSSVGKENSLDRNYGQGIRTSVLFWSDLLCITYKHGVAHYVWLGKEDLGGNDFEIDIKSHDGTDAVQECTDWVKENAKSRGYNLDEDFTEVIILGKEANPTQDTFLNPYDPEIKMPKQWISKSIYSRFWNIPDNVKLILHENVSLKGGQFMTFKDCFFYDNNQEGAEKKSNETVKIQEGSYRGARIHYYYDAPVGAKLDPVSKLKANDRGWAGGNISSIVINNEMYDVKNHASAEQSSLIKLGIHKNHRHFKIVFELPNNAGYTYDMYRTKVLRGQDEILFDNEDVLLDIVNNMPKWFKDLVNETKIASKMDVTEAIKQRLKAQKDLFNSIAGMTTNSKGSMQGQTGNKNPNPTPRPKPSNRKPIIRNNKGKGLGDPVLPEIIPNPSVTEPFFAKVEGTSSAPILFTNPDWKHLDQLSLQIDPTKGQWYLRAKELLENEFTICAVIWWFNALSENIKSNITADEYADTITPKSINMYLMAIQTSVFEGVKSSVYKEIANEAKEIQKTEEVV